MTHGSHTNTTLINIKIDNDAVVTVVAVAVVITKKLSPCNYGLAQIATDSVKP